MLANVAWRCALAFAIGACGEARTQVESTHRPAGYLADLERLSAITSCGNAVAVSCHNCYYDDDDADPTNEDAAATTRILEQAIDAEADLLELDVRGAAQGLIVEHDQDDSGARLEDVLHSAKLRDASQPLFIEVKEPFVDEASTLRLLRALFATIERVDMSLAASAGQRPEPRFVRPARPLFVRAIRRLRPSSSHLHLAFVDTAARETPYVGENVRRHVLLPSDVTEALDTRLDEIASAEFLGIDAIEFDYQQPNLFAGIIAAKRLGLGIGIYTLPDTDLGRAAVALFREDVDFVTTDARYAGAGTNTPVRQRIVDATTDLYLDATDQVAFPLRYCADQASTRWVTSTQPPTIDLGLEPTQTPLPGAMVFSGQEYASGEDLGSRGLAPGLLISSVLTFDDFVVPAGERSVIVARADGRFSLELAGESDGSYLRFEVLVSDRRFYVQCPTLMLDLSVSHLLAAKVDERGAMELWIDGDICAKGESTLPAPRAPGAIMIGAMARGHVVTNGLRGRIQGVRVQEWLAH